MTNQASPTKTSRNPGQATWAGSESPARAPGRRGGGLARSLDSELDPRIAGPTPSRSLAAHSARAEPASEPHWQAEAEIAVRQAPWRRPCQ